MLPRFLTCCTCLLQKWPRQKLEDGDLSQKVWEADRAESDAEDFNSISNTPKPPKDAPTGRTKPKAKKSTSAIQAAETGDDDCQITEVLDRLPISYARLTSSAAADTEGQATGSSRGTKRTSDDTAPEEAPKKTKRKLRLAADATPRPLAPNAPRPVKVRARVVA